MMINLKTRQGSWSSQINGPLPSIFHHHSSLENVLYPQKIDWGEQKCDRKRKIPCGTLFFKCGWPHLFFHKFIHKLKYKCGQNLNFQQMWRIQILATLCLTLCDDSGS